MMMPHNPTSPPMPINSHQYHFNFPFFCTAVLSGVWYCDRRSGRRRFHRVCFYSFWSPATASSAVVGITAAVPAGAASPASPSSAAANLPMSS